MMEPNSSNQAQPSPVSFKERSNDRVFKHITFPGESGLYRVKALNADSNVISEIKQKTLNTGILVESVDGEKYRVKAVLSQPDFGVTESHWLTLNHHEYSGVQPHNQYRARGISKESWKSNWVYSEARDDMNQLIIYEMLYDLLNILDRIEDDKFELFLSAFVEDAYKALELEEKLQYAYTYDLYETHEHHLREEARPLGKATFRYSEEMGAQPLERAVGQASPRAEQLEKLTAEVRSSFSFISKELRTAFKEEFMISKKEFSELLRVYRAYDKFTQNPGSMVTIVMEVFLEEYLEKIVKASKIEMLLENDENKALWLESEYDFDIKSELITYAYSLMPTDSFVLLANSTVKLISEPVMSEEMDYGMAVSVQEALRVLSSHIQEVLDVGISEDLYLFMRLMLQEAYMPYIIMESRMTEITTETSDSTDLDIQGRSIKYDLYDEGQVNHYSFLHDIISTLFEFDLLQNQVQIDLAEKFLDHVVDRQRMDVSYFFEESLDMLSRMGERFSNRFKALFLNDERMVLHKDETVLYDPKRDAQKQENVHTAFADGVQQDLDKSRGFSEQTAAYLADYFQKSLSIKQIAHDHMTVDLVDNLELYAPKVQHAELLSADLEDRTKIRATIRRGIQEYYRTINESNTELLYKMRILDNGHMAIMHLKREIELETSLADLFEMKGRDRVLYALGEMSDDGWPIGIFILGTNTLKG
jgi:hypothetical protein